MKDENIDFEILIYDILQGAFKLENQQENITEQVS